MTDSEKLDRIMGLAVHAVAQGAAIMDEVAELSASVRGEAPQAARSRMLERYRDAAEKLVADLLGDDAGLEWALLRAG